MNSGIIDRDEIVERHFIVFQELACLAERALLEGNYEKSAAYAQVAAHYAWFHPTGLLASVDLEGILTQIGHVLKQSRNPGARATQMPPRKVLHVITEVYGLGGHTRLVWRWIRSDRKRKHSVVLTAQGQSEVPSPLKAEVLATGGELQFLDRLPGGMLARARSLRRLANGYDHVVLHTYPCDVIPVIAFSERQQCPPVTLMNKDDHVFWLGASVAYQVAQMRDSGRRLCQQRRGLSESQCPLLPIPLEVKSRTRTRAEAKRQLGLPEDIVVMLSVATAYKYSASAGDHFAEILLRVLQEHQDVVLLVIGPEENGEWASAIRQAQGRLKVFGKLRGVELFYEAADIYLDSFPFSSLTSILEAGSYGTPIVGFHFRPSDAATINGDDPALTDLMVRAYTADDYRLQLSLLIRDDELRIALGKATRESIIAYHAEGGWNHFLEELYLRPKPDTPEPLNRSQTHRNVTELDLRLAQVFKLSGLSKGLDEVIRYNVGLFPFGTRIGIWWRTFKHEWRSTPRCLLANWQKTRLKLLWSRYGKRIFQTKHAPAVTK